MKHHLLFSGQGAQTVGMGRSLHESSATARQRYTEASDTLGWDVAKASFEGPEELLTETRTCQPALYVHGYLLFELLREKAGWGDDRIASVFGLSLGELTALAAAGVYSFADGLRIVAARGRLMQEACAAHPGGMAALIGGSREEAEALAHDFDLDVANFNCPGQIVISGLKGSIKEAVAAAPDRGFRMARALNVAGAYHSRLMAPAAQAFEAVLRDFSFAPPRFAVYTNTTGGLISEPEEIKRALVRQVTGSVYFEDNLRRAAADQNCTSFVECGPGAVFGGFVRRIDKSWAVKSVSEYEDLETAS